ncbi:MAG TPA: YvcK family protein [Candidatus Acetothermia bacterium]|nr:YvcK family protein [Candidatus Acetothermia bacterium]
MKVHSSFKFLLPGIGIKRWLAVTLASVVLIAFGAVCLVGREGVRGLYEFVFSRWPSLMRPMIGALALAIGVLGVGFGLLKSVRSVLHAVSPGSGGALGEALYQARVLKAAPKVVAIGGGTGLSNLLRGLKAYTANLTAMVTVMDTGGSSGRLRQELSVLPPGDVRNCLLALAEDEERMAKLFQFRFVDGEGLRGHALGNLVLAALEQATGGFDRAVEEASYFLSVRGQVLPATLDRVDLVAEMEDGERVVGEAAIAKDPRAIRRVWLSAKARAYDRVLSALAEADLITVGPGSLFTSIVPNLLVEGVAEAIARASGEKIVIMNLMTQPGETDGFTAHDHLRVLSEYVDLSRFNAVVVNTGSPPPDILARYRAEGSVPVVDDLRAGRTFGLRVIRAPLLSVVKIEGKPTIKHDPERLARLLVEESRGFRRSWTRWFSP